MTAHFAIPATSFVLKAIIERRLDLVYTGFTAPKVSIAPPPRPPATVQAAGDPESAGLILYMHHAATNSGLRNAYEPHIEASGSRRFAKAPLVLDLHYMLAATGADLEREALLGAAMVALHRHGIVPRPLIAEVLGDVVVNPQPGKLMEILTTEPLHDPASQPEQITVTPQPMDVDMSTKLWSALQSPMRPAAYYLVTTVFLDVDETVPKPKRVTKVRIADRPSPDPLNAATPDVISVTGTVSP